MFGTIVALFIVLLVAVFFGFLATRAWGSKRAYIKWPGLILAGLLMLVVLLVFFVGTVGAFKLYAPAGNPVASVQVAGTPEQIKRGEKFASVCAGCHSTESKPPLNGSAASFTEGGGPPIGTVYAPNLTPAGETKGWSDGEIIRAIREGVHKSGRPLVIMPSVVFHNLSDSDVQSVVAFLRSQPATKNTPGADAPANQVNLLGALFVGAGMFGTSAQPTIIQPVSMPAIGPNADYGRYLVNNLGCHDCHGEDLAGGTPGGFAPVGPNLTAIVPKMSEADFIKIFRTGTAPDGRNLDPKEMPWKDYAGFAGDSDMDLKAIYAYLHGLALIEKPASK